MECAADALTSSMESFQIKFLPIELLAFLVESHSAMMLEPEFMFFICAGHA